MCCWALSRGIVWHFHIILRFCTHHFFLASTCSHLPDLLQYTFGGCSVLVRATSLEYCWPHGTLRHSCTCCHIWRLTYLRAFNHRTELHGLHHSMCCWHQHLCHPHRLIQRSYCPHASACRSAGRS